MADSPNFLDLIGEGSSSAGSAAKSGQTVTDDDINTAAQAAGVNPDLFRRLVMQESAGRASATSPKGAQGPAQLMPGTAAQMGVNPLDSRENLLGGARYLRSMLDRYHGDVGSALAAYNAGPGAVDKAGGVPNIPETQAYVRAIMGLSLIHI